MKLDKKVHAENEVQRLLEYYYDKVMDLLPQFVGQKIILASGGRTKKFNDALKGVIDVKNEQPKGYNGEYAQLHYLNLTHPYNGIFLKISCCFKNTENTCFYVKDQVYIGELDNQYLKKLRPDRPTFSKYDTNEVKQLKGKMENLERELYDIKGKINRFKGYYD